MASNKEDLTLPTSSIIPNTSPGIAVKFIFFKVTAYCITFGIGICFLHTSLIIYAPSSLPSSFISFSFFSSILSSIVGL